MSRGHLIRARKRVDGQAVDKRAVFVRHPLFGNLPPEDIESIASYARVERFRKGATIFHKGDLGAGLMAVLLGEVKISVPSSEGKEAVLNIIRAGQVFGEIALLDGQPRTADAVAMSDCDLLVLDRREFVPLLRSNPDLALRIMELLCARLRRTSEQVEDVMFLHLEGRLAKALLRLSRDQGQGGESARCVAITQRELGQMIGMSRESTNKQLQDWQRNGWVKLVKGGVEIADPTALDAMTDPIETAA
ncbi:MAG: Crp/Fnr family transcriptional regulator [Alphaproteobacteria bacterium]|nr:Crp/Fnr family transcriptional regulator [Alphaproteobacteria bacterium]